MDTALSAETIWQTLDSVKDPEIPAVSLIEMGIIRDVTLHDDGVTVTMTPTFSGCPALHVMENDIVAALTDLGIDSVTVERQLSPAWTSDWITDEGRAKLKAYGLQPPGKHGGNLVMTFFDPVSCPRCDSANTSLKNSFGPTLCRAIWVCNDCREPFEQFKPL